MTMREYVQNNRHEQARQWSVFPFVRFAGLISASLDDLIKRLEKIGVPAHIRHHVAMRVYEETPF